MRLGDALERVTAPMRAAVEPVTDRLPTLISPERARSVLAFADEHDWQLLAALTLMGALVPLGLESGFYMTVLTELFVFGVLALSWDLVGGQTGYPSFGQMGFFGIGAYTTAILVKTFGVAFPPAFVLAGALSLAAAAIIGVIVLRLRGGYFAIATLGVLLAAQQVSLNLEMTNGPDGIILFSGPDDVLFYYLLLGVLVAEVAVVRYLSGTRFGYVLNAIRDDEEKAVAMGFDTTYYKTAAWMLAALFTGFAGGAWSLFNTFVNPQTAYNLAWNVELIAMALLGGTGTVAGPVIGAFGLHLAVVQIDTWFAGWQLGVVGTVVIVTVIAFPHGVVGFLRNRASAMEYYEYGGQAVAESPPDEGESNQ